MAKRRSAKREAASEEASVSASVSASGDASHNASHNASRDASHIGLPVEKAQGLVDDQWIRGQWSGLERWECLYCAWDTLEGLEAARAHTADCPRCGPAAMARGQTVLVSDRHGREVRFDVKGES